MAEPDTTVQHDEVDGSSEQTLGIEKSIHTQVQPLIQITCEGLLRV